MKKLGLTTAALMFSIIMLAQPGGEERKRMERLKIAFLTEELDLSVEESQQFWPVYNEFQDKEKEIGRATGDRMRKLHETDNPSESEVSSAIDDLLATKQAHAQAEADYLQQCLKILGPKKTMKLMHSEKKFRERVLKEFRDQNRERPGGRPGGGGPMRN